MGSSGEQRPERRRAQHQHAEAPRAGSTRRQEPTEKPPIYKARWRPTWLIETPFWTFSAAIHLVLLCLLVLISSTTSEEEKKTTSVAISMRAKRESTPPPQPKTRPLNEIPRIEKVTRPVTLPKIDTTEREEPVRLRNADDIKRSIGLHTQALGIAGRVVGSTALYRERVDKGSLIREGGSEGTESAVKAALDWLRRHQHPDGSWRASHFVDRCETLCTNKNPESGHGFGLPKYDVGVTALAVLAMTGYGHTHRTGTNSEYVECLRKAVAYLLRVQVRSDDPDVNGRYGGTIGHWPYNHSIATMAMAELLVMSGDVVRLGRSVKDAVLLILGMRNENAAWRYGVRDGENDTSVTGWMVLALKTARNAGLAIPDSTYDQALEDAIRFVDSITDEQGKTGYTRQGDFRTPPIPCMTAVALLSRLFAGEPRNRDTVRRAVDVCMQQLPLWDEESAVAVNPYYWYYATFALFQVGGKPWRKWNVAMKHALLGGQRRGGDENGSWDPLSKWGRRAGRVYSTAIGAMTLEVYYRFSRSIERRTTVSQPANGKAHSFR